MCLLIFVFILVVKVWYFVEFVLFRFLFQVWFSLILLIKIGGVEIFIFCVVNCFYEFVYDNLLMCQKRLKKFYWLYYLFGFFVVVGSCIVVVKYLVVVDVIIFCVVVVNGIVVMGIVVMGVEVFMDGFVLFIVCFVGVIVYVYIVI